MGAHRLHAQSREIKSVEVPTPLIVPSFSSRGFPQLTELWAEFRHRLYGVALISSYDIAEQLIPAGATESVNLAFLDSGQYETNDQFVNLSGRHVPASSASWTRDRYHQTLTAIDKTANVVLVNFDHAGKIGDQVTSASEDFSVIPSAATDFLVKPEPNTGLVNVAKLTTHSEALEQFDVIGVTAREAGSALLARCRSVVMLRDTLTEAGLDLPIHVFGAITPKEILTYYFCGADIFDGLNWLRQAFRNLETVPIEDTAFEAMKWKEAEQDLFDAERTHNLRVLYRLQEALRQYSDSGDMEFLEKEFPNTRQAATLAEIAGAEIRYGGVLNERWFRRGLPATNAIATE